MKKQPENLKNILIPFFTNMVEVNSKERFLDIKASQKFGRAWEFGRKILGQGYFGEEERKWCHNEAGCGQFGMTEFGSNDERYGEYQGRREGERVFTIRRRFCVTKNPRTIPQQAHRQKYGEAVGAWRNLTAEQKEVYNKRAIGKKFSGYNLFVKEYLLSS